MIKEKEKILRDALWMAYCSGRANNKYIPEEVLPDLMQRCQLFEPKPDECQAKIERIFKEIEKTAWHKDLEVGLGKHRRVTHCLSFENEIWQALKESKL